MIRVMFVDDEPAILEGLENRLRGLRREWDMSFVLGGKAARERIGEEFDAVVTDIRMPGVDGLDLLRALEDSCPSTVRIVLSGETQQNKLLNVLPLAHQVLRKPCEADTLREAVERTRVLHSMVTDPKLRARLGRVKTLPSPPATYRAMMRALESPRSCIETVADIVVGDPALTAHVLHFANSTFLSARRQIVSARDAVAYIGLDAVRSLALSEGIMQSPEGMTPERAERAQDVQSHAHRVAGLVFRILGSSADRPTAFSAAILHDVGCLTDLDEDLTSATAGATLLAIWGIPYSIVEPVAFHRDPSLSHHRALGIVGALHVADTIDDALQADPAIQRADVLPFDLDFLRRVKELDRLQEWLDLARASRTEGP